MPQTQCCVPKCLNRGGHTFPKDPVVRKKWLTAIRRLEISSKTTKNLWEPKSKSAVVCKGHFTENDYLQVTVHGCNPLSRRLRKGAVPSRFLWSVEQSLQAQKREERAKRRRRGRHQRESESTIHEIPEISAEVECASERSEGTTQFTEVDSVTAIYKECSTQTVNLPGFCVEKYENKPKGIAFYTGLESYEKFMFVLHTLGPVAYKLKYYYSPVHSLSVKNQFFMTLIKLRRAWENFQLSDMFEVSETTVTNIVVTWINFMFRQWSRLNMWPQRNTVSFHMPLDFKKKFPQTRVIVDGTEIPIEKPSAPLAQQATFSTYKNRNTAKVLVGVTPGGMVSYVSDAYGGSTSDRQIVERSDLPRRCDPNDVILADKGFKVQDLFAPYDVTVNHPTFFDKKNRLSGDMVMKDRKIASKRVHVERIIGQAKTYQILKKPLNATETKMATRIISVCFMLTNFRSRIVSKYA